MKPAPIEVIKQLREKTGAGIADCKKALKSCSMDVPKALKWLKKQGLAQMAKRAGKEAVQGVVASYVHLEGKIGVLVEVNTETDFAGRSEAFLSFVKHLTLHITAMNPLFISLENIPETEIQKQKALFKEQALKSGKPDKVIDKIIEGQMTKWTQEICLLDQVFFHPDNQENEKTVKEALGELTGQVREKIVIRRFVRYELGQAV